MRDYFGRFRSGEKGDEGTIGVEADLSCISLMPYYIDVGNIRSGNK